MASISNPGSRLRKIGWAMVLVLCASLYGALHLRVNSVKSEVLLAERQIVALQQEKILLETEFQTRANQRQLATWNQIEFGYKAPDASQFLEGERQLAQFGSPRAVGAPEPIRVATAPQDDEAGSVVDFFSAPAMAAEGEGETLPPVDAFAEELSTRLMQGAGSMAEVAQ